MNVAVANKDEGEFCFVESEENVGIHTKRKICEKEQVVFSMERVNQEAKASQFPSVLFCSPRLGRCQ